MKHLAWALKTNCPFTFYVFQTKLNKEVKIFVDYQNRSEMYKWYQVLAQ